MLFLSFIDLSSKKARGEKESMVVFPNTVVGHLPFPLATLYLVLLLTFSHTSSYTPDEDTFQATEGCRVVRPARGCGHGRRAKATLATSSSDKCRSDLKPGRGRGGRKSSRVGATSLTIGAVSDDSGKSLINTHTRPSMWFTHISSVIFASC